MSSPSTRSGSAGSAAGVTFPDGSVLGARVTDRPFLTRRLPPEQVGSLGVRTISVVVTLAPETSWPKEQLIHGLPLEVRFPLRMGGRVAARDRRPVVRSERNRHGPCSEIDPMIPDRTPPESRPRPWRARSAITTRS